jgi:hypothetical protein
MYELIFSGIAHLTRPAPTTACLVSDPSNVMALMQRRNWKVAEAVMVQHYGISSAVVDEQAMVSGSGTD